MAYPLNEAEFRALLQRYLDAANAQLEEERHGAGKLVIRALPDTVLNGADGDVVLMEDRDSNAMERYTSVRWLHRAFNHQEWQADVPSVAEISDFFNESILGPIALYQNQALTGLAPSNSLIKTIRGDAEAALQRIYPAVCSTKKNRKMLAGRPHFEIMDLSVYYIIIVEPMAAESITDIADDSAAIGKLTVENRHLERWNERSSEQITEKTLFERACENEKAAHQILRYKEMGEKADVQQESLIWDAYISTNKLCWFGASAAFLQIGMDDLAGREDANLFILPSSVHETILLPDNGRHNLEWIARTVALSNKTLEDPADFLSDNVYYYDRKQKALSVAYHAEAEKQTKQLEKRKAVRDAKKQITPENTLRRRGR